MSKSWKGLPFPAALVVFLVLLGGCNTMEGALMGAGLGAGTGALTGSLSGRAGAGTAIGAGAGALIGGIMGAHYEQMEKERQAAAAGQYPVGGTGPAPASYPYSGQPTYYPYRGGNSGAMQGEQPYPDQPVTATPITTVVNCPHCEQALDVSDFKKGSKVRCPACDDVFVY